jgi:hypothetical protein
MIEWLRWEHDEQYEKKEKDWRGSTSKFLDRTILKRFLTFSPTFI